MDRLLLFHEIIEKPVMCRELVQKIRPLDVFCGIVTLLDVVLPDLIRETVLGVIRSVLQGLDRNAGIPFGKLGNPRKRFPVP